MEMFNMVERSKNKPKYGAINVCEAREGNEICYKSKN